MSIKLEDEPDVFTWIAEGMKSNPLSFSNDLVDFESAQPPQVPAVRKMEFSKPAPHPSGLSVRVPTPTATAATAKRKKGKAGKADGELSPKSQAQREKNREAVRKCRKRKKAHAMELKERAVQLEEENAKLRMQLQLGNEDVRREKTEQGEKLVQDMARYVNTSGGDSDVQLRRAVTLYTERHQDHGRDRQAAIGYILSRLKRLVQPARTTKMYLWQMSQESEAHFADPIGTWREMCTELGLTPDQERLLMQRRAYARLLRAELAYDEDKMMKLRGRMKRNKDVGDAFTELTTILQPRQFAKFVLWVHNDPACKDILDRLWDEVLKDCDEKINVELMEHKDHNEKVMILLRGARRDCAALTKQLFEATNPVDMQKLARVCFDEEIVVVDPNNGGEMAGVNATVRYVRRIQRAFQNRDGTESLKVVQKSLAVDETGKGHGCWTLSGRYQGKLKSEDDDEEEDDDDTTTGGQPDAEDVSVSRSSGGQKRASRRGEVSFDVVIHFNFAPDSEKVKEMIISWDAMSLMAQLGLMNTKRHLSSKARMEHKLQNAQSKYEKMVAKCKATCEQLCRLFELPKDQVPRLADSILHPHCTMVDSHIGGEYQGVKAAVEYISRIKTTFPKLAVEQKFVTDKLASATNGQGDDVKKELPMMGKPPEFHISWNITGTYGGTLVETEQPCFFTADVFATCDPTSLKVLTAQFSFNAADLMHQLGILPENVE